MNESTRISLRISLTEQCQLRCPYCRPAYAKVLPAGWVASSRVWARRIKALAAAVCVDKVRLTGGEPLLYPDIEEVLRSCAEAGIPDIALTTNGFRLAPMARSLREAGLQRINISFDSPDPEIFKRITGANPARVMAGIDAALSAGLVVKLNAVIMRGVNDHNVMDLLIFAADRKVPIRFLEMMPIGPAAREFDQRYISGREMMEQLQANVRLEPLAYEPGETSRDFQAHLPDGRKTVCGFILPTSQPFCDGCRRLRIASDGKLMGCLAQPDTLSIEEAVAAMEQGDPSPLQACVSRALSIKSRVQRFRDQRIMQAVGG